MDDLSITDRAYKQLRRELIDCCLPPGSRLNISSLQDQFSLSQAAVREALSRLTSEGLVEIERHRGFRVAPVSMSGFRELSQACLAVELPCLRSSIENGDREWEMNLVSAYHRAVRRLELVVAGQEDVYAYSTERLAFYEVLLAACDNSWLLWSWRLLYAQNMRYRHMYMPLAKFEIEQHAQHEAFLKMALARDVKKAVEAAMSNYDAVIRFIEAGLADENAALADLTAPVPSLVPTRPAVTGGPSSKTRTPRMKTGTRRA